ncbi:hypothetical protein QFZ75_006337 [Streptomyces sp. V3I8]|uniref:hypothetical protein n=1 Tax=Streptomyces sp. V3I8 TaxID=3042279 RepID=UPI002783C3CC|nr:hypothetical protein [Streptomyces sp. V3I8]MDQ1039921.1 hypothetical protein [Streptomyces sp. V3I8]
MTYFPADGPWFSFQEFTAHWSPEQIRGPLAHDPTCLADFIQVWVQRDDGIRTCRGSREVFLYAVLVITDFWERDKSGAFLHYVTDDDPATGDSEIIERYVETVFGDKGTDHPILDPDWFETWAFRKLHPDLVHPHFRED